MANSETLKALFDNPEFLANFQNLIQEHISKSELANDIIENGQNGNTNVTNNERRSLGNGTIRARGKRKKIANQSSSKQNNCVENIQSLLKDEDIQKKITPCINKYIKFTDNTDNYSEEKVVKSISSNIKNKITTEDISRFSIEEITFPNHNAAVMEPSDESFDNVRSPRKSLRLNQLDQSQLYIADNQYPENNVPLNKEVSSNEINAVNKYSPGADVVVGKETINDVLNKDNKVIVPAESINEEIDSSDKNNPTDNNMSLDQTTDLNFQSDENNFEMSHSDDFYYLSMANISNIIKEPEIKSTPSNILDVSKVDKSITNILPDMSASETKPITIKQKIKMQSEIVEHSLLIPNSNVVCEANQTNSESIGLVNALNTSNYQTIIVITDKGEQPIKILHPNVQNIDEIKKSSGSKPVIKSNERVQLQGKKLKKFRNDTSAGFVNDISDNIIINADLSDSLKMPKIESVMSIAESLPRITSVTSCATSVSDIENIVTHSPVLQTTTDIIPVTESISSDLVNSSEKILTIKRHVPKGKCKRKSQKKNVEQVKDNNGEGEKNSNSFSSSTLIDATIEEVIAKGASEMHDSNSVALNEKKSQENSIVHMNGLNATNTERKGLKVLRPVKRIDYFSNDVQSDDGNISFRTAESVDGSGLPNIKNVVSLAETHQSDNCLEEANEDVSNSNGIYTASSLEKNLNASKPVDSVDNGYREPDEFFENLDIDIHSENDDFNNAIDSLIEDISGKKFSKASTIKKKITPPLPKKLVGASNARSQGVRTLKPVIRRQKRGRRKTKYVRRKIRTVKYRGQSNVDDVDLMGMDFDNLNLVDTGTSFANSEHNEASFDQNAPIKIDTLLKKLSPMKSRENIYETSTKLSVVKEKTELPDSYVSEPLDSSRAAVEDYTSDCSTRAMEEYEELLEEVPLNQRRCNNFYVKVPTGEELGSNINMEEYEKFFSIQDENDPKKIRKVEIESLDNDEDLQGTPGKPRTKCSKCDKTFVNTTNRKIHEATCENSNPQSSECSKCGRWFANTSNRRTHEKKCQQMYSTIEVPVAPLNNILKCAMCPFTTGHKTAYINHLKSHMYSHKKLTYSNSKAAALRKKFGYRRKKRKLRIGVIKNRCEICNDDAGGVEHMVSRCRRCGEFNVQWCDECHKGGYSTACRLRHHDAECTATPHTRCILCVAPRVSLEKIGPPLPLHCVDCNLTRILYVREKRCKQCLSQLVFKCEMCDELRDTYAELCGHIARGHIYGCLVQCDDCGKNCEDLTLHRRVCDSQSKENASAFNRDIIRFSDDEDSNEDTTRLSLDNLILELDEDPNEDADEHDEEHYRIEEV